MRIARGLMTVADFVPALEDEAAAKRSLMPEDLGLASLFSHDGAADWAHRRTTGDFTPIPGQVVPVRKPGHGVRPVAELSVRDRVLYRALTRRWQDRLEGADRSSEAYETFRRAPVAPGVSGKYVVSSDVTACYLYIDHGLLAREILARTGDSDGIDALTSLLAGITGRSYGLPQQSEPSDLLAEAYLSIVERMWRVDSAARSSQANTQEVMIVSSRSLNPSLASVAKKVSHATSPWPMSRCWWTRTWLPGGLVM